MNSRSSRPSGSEQLPDGPVPVRPDPIPIGEYLFAGVSVALGIYLVISANFIRIPGSSNTLGPTVFPILVGIILAAAGAIVLFGVWRGKLGEAEEGEDIDLSVGTDWVMVGKLVGLFVAHCYLIGFIGWPLAGAILFAGSAWALGARKWWMAASIGLGLALVIQVLFGQVLGLSLPPGPLLDWIPFL